MIISIEVKPLATLHRLATAAASFRELWRVGQADKEVAAFLELSRALDRLTALGWRPDAKAPIDPPAIVSGAGNITP